MHNLPVQSEITLVDWPLADEDVMTRVLVNETIRYRITRQITCEGCGQVLDVRTAVGYADHDGDVLAVVSPNCDTAELRTRLRRRTAARYAVKGTVQ